MTSEERLQQINEWCSIQTPERMATAIHKVEQEKEALEAEKKDLIQALKAIESVTSDETLPLFRVINQIAIKSLKAIK